MLMGNTDAVDTHITVGTVDSLSAVWRLNADAVLRSIVWLEMQYVCTLRQKHVGVAVMPHDDLPIILCELHLSG